MFITWDESLFRHPEVMNKNEEKKGTWTTREPDDPQPCELNKNNTLQGRSEGEVAEHLHIVRVRDI